MRDLKKILIIIQRSNGDVFFSKDLIFKLYCSYNEPDIDLLVNDDTYAIAKLIPNVKDIITFSYQEKKQRNFSQEKNLISKIYKKYDLSISLTASDRSVLYSILSSKFSISAIENNSYKSWWKKIFLTKYYVFNSEEHIISNNLKSLRILNIKPDNELIEVGFRKETFNKIQKFLKKIRVKNFLVFHPSAQYDYKIYPELKRNQLIGLLASLKIDIVITGGNSELDQHIQKTIPKYGNIHNLIGLTTLEEYLVISSLSSGYIGMDTLNMHIAASQNKKIFAIFGPTNLKMWSPWSNKLGKGTTTDMPLQNYDKVTIFQADLPCVACGRAGCDDKHGISECLHNIEPNVIFNEIKTYIESV